MIDISLILNFLIAYGTCQAFFIAFVLLKTENKTLFKKLFSLFLIIEGVTLIERLLVETNLIVSIPHILGVSYPISFIKPPLIFFMACSLTLIRFKLNYKSYLHFIPFVLMLLLNLPFYFLEADKKIETVRGFMANTPDYQNFEFYFGLSFFIYIGVYVIAGIHKLKQFKTQVTNNTLVNWYYHVLLLYTSFLALHFVFYVFQPLGGFKMIHVNQISMLIMTFIIQSIAYKLVDKSSIFNSKIVDLSDLKKRKKDEKLIISKFEIDKIHIDNFLTLERFSASVSLPAPYVSEIINQKFNCSFKNLVAQYRLNEAKSIMKQKTHSKTKLIEIAYDSGFNNKVSFYRTFKLYEGISPSEFLEQLKNK